MGFAPRDQLNETLTCCHAALISLRDGMEDVAVPSKLYGILAFGRTVIAQVPKESEVALVVNEEKCGCVVEPGDAAALARTILELSTGPELIASMSENAYSAYHRTYTLDHAVAAFRQLWALP